MRSATEIVFFFLGIGFCISCSGPVEKPKLFKLLNSSQTGIHFQNNIIETETMNINTYLYAYNGGGVATGDFNNDGLIDIYFTANQQSNRLYLNTGNLTFQDVTNKSGTAGLYGPEYWTTGVTLVDINQDGWLDIYCSQVSGITGFKGHNQLFINNGDLTFTESSATYNLDLQGFGQQAVFFDYDKDGDLDMYQANHSAHSRDVYVKIDKRMRKDTLAGDRLMRNNSGKFVDVTEEAGLYNGSLGYSLSVSIADFNNDNYPDIYISNDFHDNDYLYLNQKDGQFKDVTITSLGHSSTFSMGSDAADLNNDGWIDILSLDMRPDDLLIRKQSAGADSYEVDAYKRGFGYHYQYPRNMLQINQGLSSDGDLYFSEIGQLAKLDATDWSWSVLLSDFDNDASKDIFITNGILRRPNNLDYINYTYNEQQSNQLSTLELSRHMPPGATSNYVFKNARNLEFKDVSKQWGMDYEGYSMGSAVADFDNDGDLDVVVNNLNDKALIYENTTSDSQTSLTVSLNGKFPNRNGIGAKVEVWSGEEIQTQQNYPVRGWLSTSTIPLHFGLNNNKIDKVKVTWPSGKIEVKQQVKSNRLNFKEEDAIAEPKSLLSSRLLVEKVFKSGIDFKHKEDQFNDFISQRLLPHKLSTEGPALAAGDINGDGLVDFFVGGASGYSGAIYLQNKGQNNKFNYSPQEIINRDIMYEDVDATLFDIDGDGDLDLFVVSGISAIDNQNGIRGYINDGSGNFEALPLPQITGVLGSLSIHDFDQDGFSDLFLGARATKENYGARPDSYILFNSGKAIFKEEDVFKLDRLGMVTDSKWDESRKSLIIVGEWMPVTSIKFKGRTFNKTGIPHTEGWWNSITLSDLNHDGLNDFLLGNYGLNSEFEASLSHPLKLVVKDFDKNGKDEPLLIYSQNGKEHFFADLDLIKTQIPGFKALFPNYKSFADFDVATFLKNNVDATTQLEYAYNLQSGILYQSNASGDYIFKAFPRALQFSPIQDIDIVSNDRNSQYLIAVGNFFENSPSIGKQDASGVKIIELISTDNEFSYTIRQGIGQFKLSEDYRKVEFLKSNNDKAFILTAASNDSLQLYNLNFK